jgi:hypothetical protein
VPTGPDDAEAGGGDDQRDRVATPSCCEDVLHWLAFRSFRRRKSCLPNALLAFPKFPSRDIWFSVASLRFHEPGELRLGEGQQRADGFGFDIEDSCHGGGFHPLVA